MREQRVSRSALRATPFSTPNSARALRLKREQERWYRQSAEICGEITFWYPVRAPLSSSRRGLYLAATERCTGAGGTGVTGCCAARTSARSAAADCAEADVPSAKPQKTGSRKGNIRKGKVLTSAYNRAKPKVRLSAGIQSLSFHFRTFTRMIRVCFFVLTLLTLGNLAQAQSFRFRFYDSIQVTANGQPLRQAWAGGLQAPQFNRIDLNGDGIKDLVVFDRADNSILPFLSSSTPGELAYTFAPDYAAAFPDTLDEWVLLADYNCDGLEDIFTSNEDESGVAVYTNTSVGGTLSFALLTPLLSSALGQVQVSVTDIPALADVDNDGDLDLLAFGFGGDRVFWYRNRRVEDNLPCSALQLGQGSLCWGDFQENALNSSITLGLSCRYGPNPVLPEPTASMHPGSTLLAFDADGDGDKDALVGDISTSEMIFLESGGGSMVAQTTNFPAGHPAVVYTFPAAFYVDADNDQLPDLLVTPNNGSDGGGRNFEQVLFYRNTGSAAAPSFTFQKNDFLVGQMIEAGAGAAPAFFDEDADGDLDLLIGNLAYRQNATTGTGQLTLFRNTGSNAIPRYELVTTNYLNAASLSLYNLCPAFADLDGDGDQDLVLGEQSGKLVHFRNTAGPGQPAAFAFQTAAFAGINVGSHSTPQLIDLDRDGLVDLVIGERNGNINYYRNTGTATAPAFTLVTDSLGQILVTDPSTNAGYSAPHFTDLDQNGQYDLLLGDIFGRLHVYLNAEPNLAGAFAELPAEWRLPLLSRSRPLQAGRRLIPAAIDLTADGKPDVVAGLGRGGLMAFVSEGVFAGVPEAAAGPQVNVFPVPASGFLQWQLTGQQAEPVRAEVLSVLGGQALLSQQTQGRTSGAFQLGGLPAGVYVLRLVFPAGQVHNRKLIKGPF